MKATVILKNGGTADFEPTGDEVVDGFAKTLEDLVMQGIVPEDAGSAIFVMSAQITQALVLKRLGVTVDDIERIEKVA